MIIVAATPIGNLGDASERLREALATATVIAAEDTRHTAQLMRLLEISNRPEFIALHDHNEHNRAEALVQRAEREDILLVSDAGMPTVADPGYRMVHLAASRGVPVSVIPGPSAVVAALAVSGLPTDRFSFEGFVPRKGGERARLLEALGDETRTMVFFEAPTRIASTLAAMREAWGEHRPAAVCRELTKLHEEVRRGTLAELADWAEEGVRGEIVLVVGGTQRQKPALDVALDMVRSRVRVGERLKDATREVATKTGWAARELYEASLAERDAEPVDGDRA